MNWRSRFFKNRDKVQAIGCHLQGAAQEGRSGSEDGWVVWAPVGAGFRLEQSAGDRQQRGISGQAGAELLNLKSEIWYYLNTTKPHK